MDDNSFQEEALRKTLKNSLNVKPYILGRKIKTAKVITNPFYDPNSHQITFMDKTITIPSNTNQKDLCDVVFRNKNAMSREWIWEEILKKSGERNIEKPMWRKVYGAGREVNKKVAIETGTKDLLIVKKLTVRVNPKYLK